MTFYARVIYDGLKNSYTPCELKESLIRSLMLRFRKANNNLSLAECADKAMKIVNDALTELGDKIVVVNSLQGLLVILVKE